MRRHRPPPPHLFLRNSSSLIVLSDAVKSSNLGLDFWYIPCQFLLDLITAILPAGETLIQRAASLTVEGVDTAANQKIFFTDNAAADVMADVQGCHVVGHDEKGRPKTQNVLAKTKGECAAKLKALKESLKGTEPERPKGEITFGAWLDHGYQAHGKPAIKPKTQAGYENRIYQHIIPEKCLY